MKKLLLVLMLIPSLVNAAQRSSQIESIDEVNPEKGYILSIDLYQNKMCSKIWTKQIEEFKKNNPQIKDPNLILVHQKIKVQDCRVKIEEAPIAEIKELKKENKEIQNVEYSPSYFIGIFGGLNFLGGKSDDTAKNGYNLGIKAGKNFSVGHDIISVAAGYLRNEAKTSDDNNPLGVYKTKTDIIVIESSFQKSLSPKFSVGPSASLFISKDVSFTEQETTRDFAGFLGLDALFKISKPLQLELNAEQRIDDLSRLNLMTNLGLRFNF